MDALVQCLNHLAQNNFPHLLTGEEEAEINVSDTTEDLSSTSNQVNEETELQMCE